MIIATLLTALVLASGPADPAREPPVMRVAAHGLDLSSAGDASVFADRIADQSRRFCAVHAATITAERLGKPRLCERGMGEAAVLALPEAHRRHFVRAGGTSALHRRQR